jgi:hypothetical protein
MTSGKTAIVAASALVLIGIGCGDDSKPNGGGGGVTVRGQIARTPGEPVPIADVVVTSLDAAGVQAHTDALGGFQLAGVRPTSDNKLRLFIDGTTGAGGPFLTAATEFSVDAKTGGDIGVVLLPPMEVSGTVSLDATNARLTDLGAGGIQAVLKTDVVLAAGQVPGEADEPRAAEVRLPAGTTVVLPSPAPRLLNLTRVDAAAIPAPLPQGDDGKPRFTSYFVALQPAGSQLATPVALQMPEVDGWPGPMPVEIWQADTTSRTFTRKASGTVQHIPGRGDFAVPDAPFVTEFDYFAATPPCTALTTRVAGRTVDAAMRPVSGAQISAPGGVRGESADDGTFTLDAVPLGCGQSALTELTVVAALARGDGTFISASSAPASVVAGGTTMVGDLTLVTRLYVVRASPDQATAIATDTAFDVFFSEPIDMTTVGAVTMEQRQPLRAKGGGCTVSTLPIAGMAILDGADPTHIRFTPLAPLMAGENHAAIVSAARLRSQAGATMAEDFVAEFITADTVGPEVSLNFPPQAGATLLAGGAASVTGEIFDGAAVASARFQLFTTDTQGQPAAQVGNDIVANLIPADSCVGARDVRAHARIDTPGSAGDSFLLRLSARDSSGNESFADAPLRVTAPGGQTFPFCGTAQPVAYVSSNGYITFDVNDTDYTPTITKFFSHPRVSAFYTDVDERVQGASVFWNIVPGADPGFAVTWFQVGLYSALPGPDTYQIVLYQSGAIQISYDAMADTVSSTTGSAPADLFMGVSCPGTPISPAPAPTALLTPQPQPDDTVAVTNISPWQGEPVYDFLDRRVATVPTPSVLFKTRVFNFVLPGQTAPATVPTFRTGTPIPVLCDDCAAEVGISFSPGRQLILLDGGWSLYNKLNQPTTDSPTVLLASEAATSATVTSSGTSAQACTCNAQRLVVPLGRAFNCATSRLEFDYSSSVTGGTMNTASVLFRFSTATAGAGLWNASAQTGVSSCATQSNNHWPVPALLREGHNVVNLGQISTLAGACTGPFDTLEVMLEGYICGLDNNTQTLSNLELFDTALSP